MASQLLSYKGLFGDDRQPFGQLAIHHEPLRKRSSFYSFEITEHLHTNLVQIFLITSGGGLLLSSGKKIPLETPCVLVIPNNVLHGFVFPSEVRGDVFTLSDEQFEKFIKNSPSLFSNFERLQYIFIDPGVPLFTELMTLKNKIIQEFKNPDKATAFNLLLLFQLLLVNLYRSEKKNQRAVVETSDRTLKHFHTFKKLIKQNAHDRKTIQFYAHKMNLTTVHLNRICKTVTQKTALQVVHEHVIQEAKKYLKGTSHSVAEIAYFLDFKNPSHFSKFFKKLVGVNPKKFRQK